MKTGERVFSLSRAVADVVLALAAKEQVAPRVVLHRAILERAATSRIEVFPRIIVADTAAGQRSVTLVFGSRVPVSLSVGVAGQLAAALAGKVAGDQRFPTLSGGLLRLERRRGIALELPSGFRITFPQVLAAMLADTLWRSLQEQREAERHTA